MNARFFAFPAAAKGPFASAAKRPAATKLPLPATQITSMATANHTKVSLHKLVNQLLMGLQPLAMRRDNIILNGIPDGLSFYADENMLAYVLWNLINSAVNSKKNECIHVVALTEADRTMICVKDVGTGFYHTISHEYKKIQDAAERLGGTICLDNDGVHGTSISLSISNNRLAA